MKVFALVAAVVLEVVSVLSETLAKLVPVR